MQAFLDGVAASGPRAELSSEAERQFPDLAVLSADERIVAIYASLGFTNRKIARALHRAESRVKQQLRSALRTLGIKNRAALVAHNHRLQ